MEEENGGLCSVGHVCNEALSCISHEPHLNRAFQFMLSVRKGDATVPFATGFYLPRSFVAFHKDISAKV